ncbi:hypothetical protein DYY67_2010 [Candidatus Nitrosotalea sp. TS]|nr:hypothetical protein [Candidatus Nitrosotalea sp. TS]
MQFCNLHVIMFLISFFVIIMVPYVTHVLPQIMHGSMTESQKLKIKKAFCEKSQN